MVDFISSFQKGISAAQDAERNRKEISFVFKELNRQLDEATEGKIEIVRMDFDEPSKDVFTNALAAMLNSKKYRAIAVRHKIHKAFNAKELAKWRQGPAGYPCWLTTSDLDLACENRQALEQGLAALLSSPSAGEAMYQAIKFEPPTPKMAG